MGRLGLICPQVTELYCDLTCLGSSSPALGKAAHFLFPAHSDKETNVHGVKLLWDIKCTRRPFCLCQAEPLGKSLSPF